MTSMTPLGIGSRVGEWTLLSEPDKDFKVECRCSCGTVKRVLKYNLRDGKSRSCGCKFNSGPTSHGLSGSSEYEIWKGMKARCENPRHKSYRFYGAAGISVCEAWRSSFEAFLTDMGSRPTPKHTLDRRDPGGPYSPDNCRWITQKEQTRNTRRNVHVTFNGRTQCLSAWAEELGMDYSLLHKRISAGWAPEKVFSPTLYPGRSL